MKKISLLWVLLMWCIILPGCNTTEETSSIDNGASNYENNLIIEWVAPISNLWWELEDWSLSTRITFEDHSDVIIFSKWTWETYFENENDYLPGNTVSFKWEVEAVDAAAWTHYYDVKSIETLEVIGYPTEEEVKDLISRYNYCEADEDCVDFYPWCPLGCSNPVNKQYLDLATKIAKNFIDQQENKCMYSCLAPTKIVCENYKCIGVNEQINEQANEEQESSLTSAEIQEANTIFE